MNIALIKTGHGYETGSRGRCTAFDDYTVVASPLGGHDSKVDRESRVFNRQPNGNGGCCYGSHAIKLATDGNSAGRDFYILMEHGGGREVWRVPQFYDGGDLAKMILALPERLQYALLHTMYSMGRNARSQAIAETNVEWKQAISEKRIRRRKGRLEIVSQCEVDFKAEQKSREVAA
jgi:hypothetical protein